jgi:ATP-binding cassette subfamily B (MDR/TAP) protein 1
LTTIKNADQIVVMRNGSIAELGTHDSLKDKEEGIYKRLWEAQEMVPSRESGAEELNNDEDGDLGVTRNSPLNQPCRTATDDSGVGKEDHVEQPVMKLTRLVSAILIAQKRYWWAYLLLITGSTIGGK